MSDIPAVSLFPAMLQQLHPLLLLYRPLILMTLDYFHRFPRKQLQQGGGDRAHFQFFTPLKLDLSLLGALARAPPL